MFFLVSGAAAAGKTTVARSISSKLENIVCHDHDELKTVDELTRCKQLEEWIQQALACQQADQDFLLTSHSPLGELLACPSVQELEGILACLLDCSDVVRIQRMRTRGIDPRWPPTQDVLNWASWHRMHAWDPQWEQHVIVGNGPPEHSYSRWTNWNQADRRWNVSVFDTSDFVIETTVDTVAVWVQTQRVKMPVLSHKSRWWEPPESF